MEKISKKIKMKPILFDNKYAKVITFFGCLVFVVFAVCVVWISFWIVKSQQAEVEFTKRLKGEIGKPQIIEQRYITK